MQDAERTTSNSRMRPKQEMNLFPFQREDVVALRDRKSVLLAWEMGTGKTFAGMALDLEHRDDSPLTKTLVVAPLSVTHSWEWHFETYTDLKVYKIDPKRRDEFIKALSMDYDVYVLHWEALRILKPQLLKIKWLHVIADESHRAKNRKAQQTRALKKIPTAFKTALTGTPVTNKPYDLWSQLNWLYPTEFRSFWRFYETYCDYTIEYPHGYHKFKGPKNEQQLLDTIRPYYRRHLKLEQCCDHHPQGVQPDLPPKYYTDIWVDLHPKQRKAYDEMRKDMISWLETQDGTVPLVAPVVIAQLIRLQQLSVAYASITSSLESDGSMSHIVELTDPSSKIDALMQILEDNEEEQIVVFSQFKKVINLAAQRLQGTAIPYVTITGDVAHSERASAIDQFQAGSARVFLGTIGAGGEGITLTAASTVIFLDRDWSPAKNAQAEDRLHRIGQENAVQVIDIIARDTVDLGRRQKLELKKDWIRRILGDA